jgi:hypothetical protein
MPKLQFSYAQEKHDFCLPSPTTAYEIGKKKRITYEQFQG